MASEAKKIDDGGPAFPDPSGNNDSDYQCIACDEYVGSSAGCDRHKCKKAPPPPGEEEPVLPPWAVEAGVQVIGGGLQFYASCDDAEGNIWWAGHDGWARAKDSPIPYGIVRNPAAAIRHVIELGDQPFFKGYAERQAKQDGFVHGEESGWRCTYCGTDGWTDIGRDKHRKHCTIPIGTTAQREADAGKVTAFEPQPVDIPTLIRWLQEHDSQIVELQSRRPTPTRGGKKNATKQKYKHGYTLKPDVTDIDGNTVSWKRVPNKKGKRRGN